MTEGTGDRVLGLYGSAERRVPIELPVITPTSLILDAIGDLATQLDRIEQQIKALKENSSERKPE